MHFRHNLRERTEAAREARVTKKKENEKREQRRERRIDASRRARGVSLWSQPLVGKQLDITRDGKTGCFGEAV